MSGETERSLTMNVKEMAAELGVGQASAYALCRIEGFPVIHIGKRKVIIRESFYKWLEDNAGKTVI